MKDNLTRVVCEVKGVQGQENCTAKEQTVEGCQVSAGKEGETCAPVTRGGNTTGLGAEAER